MPVRRLYGLDALRGIAALAVMVGHFAAAFGLGAYPLHAGLAVDLFFILSGFVMTRTYEARLRDGLTAPQFIALRYRRLFLPLAIGSTLGLVAAAAVVGPSPHLMAAWVFMLAFLPAFWMSNAFPLNGPAWSLFVEILSNAVHAALFAKARTITIAAVCAACATVFIASYFAGLSRWDYGLDAILWLIPRELSCYLIGIILHRVYGERPLGDQPTFAVAAFVVALWAATLNPYVELACVFIVAPLVVRASLSFTKASWAIWAGALSYPLYATHVPAIELAKLVGASPPFVLAFALLLATVVTILFEVKRKPKAGTGSRGQTLANAIGT